MAKKILKITALVLTYVIVSAGGYYIGRNTSNNFTSATPKEEVSASPEASIPPPSDKENSVTYVTRSDASAAAEGTWSVVSKFSGDVTGDGEDDTVTLYTSAEKYGGEIVWDDGQNWIVEIADGNGGYYTLVNQFVNNGNVYMTISENTNQEKIVSVICTSSSCFNVKQYRAISSGFVEEVACDNSHSNVVFSSIPYYN